MRGIGFDEFTKLPQGTLFKTRLYLVKCSKLLKVVMELGGKVQPLLKFLWACLGPPAFDLFRFMWIDNDRA